MSALELIRSAKEAAKTMGLLSSAEKNQILETVARLLLEREVEILAANALDIENAQAIQMNPSLQDRLKLDSSRILSLQAAVLDLVSLNDPIGETVREITRPNGLHLKEIRVPFGVIGAIYEARPNVTIDIACMAIKTGSAIVLRGGSAAVNTNAVLVDILKAALEKHDVNASGVVSVDSYGRAGANEMMKATGLIEVLIPRGSAELIRSVIAEAKVPVIQTGDGVVHIYLDETAKLEYAIDIVTNAKVQRPTVCNALETLLVHRAAADRLLPPVLAALDDFGVLIRGDETTVKLFPKAIPATEADWATEYLSLELSVKVVESFEDALDHIDRYSTKHTESIITEDNANAERFLAEVDSAVVMVNASTRFTDGGEFGFGAEVGIATQKLHARGPMGLTELTSTKWLVRGQGQSRA